jgi:hypothetical protein
MCWIWMNQREDLGNNPGKLKNTKRNKTVMWREKVSGEKKRVTESTCNVNIEIFSKAGSTKDQKWYILVRKSGKNSQSRSNRIF